jgi:hypothetical protein
MSIKKINNYNEKSTFASPHSNLLTHKFTNI